MSSSFSQVVLHLPPSSLYKRYSLVPSILILQIDGLVPMGQPPGGSGGEGGEGVGGGLSESPHERPSKTDRKEQIRKLM